MMQIPVLQMLRYAATAATILLVTVKAETVYDAIGRHAELSKFLEMVKRDEISTKLMQHWPVSVFAPTNEAVTKSQDWVLGREKNVVSYHSINLVANTSSFPLTATASLAAAPPLYLGVKESTSYWSGKEYFVNNAKILKSESYVSQDGGNKQILYIIDEVLQPYSSISSSLPPKAYDFLQRPDIYEIREPLSAFSSRVRQEGQEDLFKRDGNHTFFIPVGAGEGHSFNRQKEVDKWVIKGHVIPNMVLFTRLAGSDSYHSEAYNDEIQVDLSVENDSNAAGNSFILHAQSTVLRSNHGHKKGVVLSKIIKPNIPVKNGVIHLIESPLLIVDITVWKFLNNEKESRLSEFLKLVNYAPEFKDLLTSSQEKTLFAPSDEAIGQLPKETMNDIKRNITALTNLLKLHLVNRSISTDDVVSGRYREYLSSDNKNSLYFRVLGRGENKTLYVDGGGVKGAAIQPDVGAVDGMVHIIDRLLGMPHQTLYLKIKSDPDLSITQSMCEQGEWGDMLNSHDKRFTFFVPSNEAWAQLRHQMPTEYKQLTMGSFSYHVHKILDRHIVVGREIYFSDINRMREIRMLHGSFRIRQTNSSSIYGYGNHLNRTQTLKPKGDKFLEWDGVEARIVRPDVQAVNGVIHVIDRVMMKRRDLTKASSAPKNGDSRLPLLIFITLLLFYQGI